MNIASNFILRIELFFIKAIFKIGMLFIDMAGYFSNSRTKSIVKGSESVPDNKQPALVKNEGIRITLDMDRKQAEFLEKSIEMLRVQYVKNTGKTPDKNYRNNIVLDLINRGIFSLAQTPNKLDAAKFNRMMYNLN